MNVEIKDLQKILKESVPLQIDIKKYISTALERPIKALIPNSHLGYNAEFIQKILNLLDIETEVIKSHEMSYLISRHQDVGKNLLFKEGIYYIMELVSTAPLYIWEKDVKNQIILDVSAAPGGKTFILSNIFKEGVIIANEPNRIRLRRLINNIQKYMIPNVIVTQHKGEKIRSGVKFDKIIFDAPCSSLNLIYKRKKEVYINLKRVKRFAELQKRIIHNLYTLLKEGGELLYMTCTLTKEECEEVVKYAIEIGYKVLEIKGKLPFNVYSPEDESYPEINRTCYITPEINLDRYKGNIGTAYIALLKR